VGRKRIVRKWEVGVRNWGGRGWGPVGWRKVIRERNGIENKYNTIAFMFFFVLFVLNVIVEVMLIL